MQRIWCQQKSHLLKYLVLKVEKSQTAHPAETAKKLKGIIYPSFSEAAKSGLVHV